MAISEGEFGYADIRGPGDLSVLIQVMSGQAVDLYLMTLEQFSGFESSARSPLQSIWFDANEVEQVFRGIEYFTTLTLPLDDMEYRLVFVPESGGAVLLDVLLDFSASASRPSHARVEGLGLSRLVRWPLLIIFVILPVLPLLTHYYYALSYLQITSRRFFGPRLDSYLVRWPFLVALLFAFALLPVERLVARHNPLTALPYAALAFDAVFAFALPEELAKVLLLWLCAGVIRERYRSVHRRERLPPQDADRPLVFALNSMIIALGYATGESLLYGFRDEVGDLTAGAAHAPGAGPPSSYTLFVRALTACPSHVVGGLIMGLLWGAGDRCRALLVPWALHVAYDLPILYHECGLFHQDVLNLFILALLYFENFYAMRLAGEQQEEHPHHRSPAAAMMTRRR